MFFCLRWDGLSSQACQPVTVYFSSNSTTALLNRPLCVTARIHRIRSEERLASFTASSKSSIVFIGLSFTCRIIQPSLLRHPPFCLSSRLRPPNRSASHWRLVSLSKGFKAAPNWSISIVPTPWCCLARCATRLSRCLSSCYAYK